MRVFDVELAAIHQAAARWARAGLFQDTLLAAGSVPASIAFFA